jgi:hypothetical protein
MTLDLPVISRLSPLAQESIRKQISRNNVMVSLIPKSSTHRFAVNITMKLPSSRMFAGSGFIFMPKPSLADSKLNNNSAVFTSKPSISDSKQKKSSASISMSKPLTPSDSRQTKSSASISMSKSLIDNRPSSSFVVVTPIPQLINSIQNKGSIETTKNEILTAPNQFTDEQIITEDSLKPLMKNVDWTAGSDVNQDDDRAIAENQVKPKALWDGLKKRVKRQYWGGNSVCCPLTKPPCCPSPKPPCCPPKMIDINKLFTSTPAYPTTPFFFRKKKKKCGAEGECGAPKNKCGGQECRWPGPPPPGEEPPPPEAAPPAEPAMVEPAPPATGLEIAGDFEDLMDTDADMGMVPLPRRRKK